MAEILAVCPDSFLDGEICVGQADMWTNGLFVGVVVRSVSVERMQQCVPGCRFDNCSFFLEYRLGAAVCTVRIGGYSIRRRIQAAGAISYIDAERIGCRIFRQIQGVCGEMESAGTLA